MCCGDTIVGAQDNIKMSILFVYDSQVEIDKINSLIFTGKEKVYLFPLTSSFFTASSINKKLKDLLIETIVINTAEVINFSAEKLRNIYIRFVAELPERVYDKKENLKKVFSLDKYTTLWWFSSISEKNTFKSEVFNRLSQLDAIVEVVNREKVGKIIFGCRNRKLQNALYDFSCINSIEFETLPTRKKGSLRVSIREFQNLFYFKHTFLLLYFAAHFFLRTWKIKRKLGTLTRMPANNIPTMIITYYPNLDIVSAKDGIFKNKYYEYLQESMESYGRDITWIAMYVKNNSLSFKESLEYAEQLIKNGYNIYFLEEFISIGMQIKCLLILLRISLKFIRIEKSICLRHTFGTYNFYKIFKDDWYSSFAGAIGYIGLLYYSVFKSLLSKLEVGKCLYYCEMHAWEKALLSAKASLGTEICFFGYQHATIPRMLLNYFNDSREISECGDYKMPQPDKIICNGQLTYSYMRECGWPEEKLCIVEAIRYNHLKEYMRSKCKEKRDIVLLVLSISPLESSSILNVIYESLYTVKSVEFWVKPHPFLQIEEVFMLSGINLDNCSFLIKNEPIEKLLAEARIAIVGESSVSIEALALGCEVVIVNAPEWINMSPLKDMKAGMVKTTRSQEELRQTILDIFKEKYNPEKYAAESRKTINDFFYLDEESNVPKKFLELLGSSSVNGIDNLTKRCEK